MEQIFTSNDLQFALESADSFGENGFHLTLHNFISQVAVRMIALETLEVL